jgi:hypothetical protein
MEVIENVIFKLTLALGWISGSFPASNPFEGSSELKYKSRWSLITLLSWLQLFLVFGIGILFNLAVMTKDNFFQQRELSDILLFYGYSIIFYIVDALRRLASILNAKELISLVRRCREIREGTNPRILSLLFLTAVPNILTHTLSLYYFYFEQEMILIADSTQFQNFLFMISVLYADVSAWFCGLFASSIVLILGSRLSTDYRNLCRDFEVQILKNTKKSKGPYLLYPDDFIKNLEYFEAEFQKLNQSFGNFQTIAGAYALAFVFEGSFGIVYFLFDIFQPDALNINGKAGGALGIIQLLLTIVSFAHIGTYIESEVSTVNFLSVPSYCCKLRILFH